MKTILLTLALALVAIARADEYSFKEPFTRTAPFNAGGELTLSNVNGNVTIKTWDKNEILVEGEKSARTDEELKLIELTIDLSPAHAEIKAHLTKRPGHWNNTIRAAVRFTITVPVTAVLERIETVNSNIKIESVRGAVHAQTVNGGITATGLAADARLRSVNGRIHVDFAAVATGKKISLNTVNGGIVATLPKDAGVTLHTSVVNGSVDCAFPIQLGHRHRHSLSGTIGDGRAELSAQSVNGSIHIEST